MDANELRAFLDEDIAETHKLLTVASRPIVRECLIQLYTTLEQASFLPLTTCWYRHRVCPICHHNTSVLSPALVEYEPL